MADPPAVVRRPRTGTPARVTRTSTPAAHHNTLTAPTDVELHIVKVPAAQFVANDTSAVADFVEIGLWDNAFAATGTVTAPLNNLAEADNFVGADSRRFYFRVKDPRARAQNAVVARWRTLFPNDTVQDAGGGHQITLNVVPGKPGLFVSKAMMVVCDAIDAAQPTHTGLPVGVARPNQPNFRIRRGGMFSQVEVEYQSAGFAALKRKVPIFQRAPDVRRHLPLQVFILRQTAGGAAIVDTSAASALWNSDLRQVSEIYEALGVHMFTHVAPGTAPANILSGGRPNVFQAVLIDPPPVTATGNPNSVTLAYADAIASLPACAPIADTIRVFYVGALVPNNRGFADPDVDFGTSARKQACFFNGVAPTYNAAHEIAHMLTNKSASVNGGHYNAPAGSRARNDQNLLRNGTSVSEGVIESKRLWDLADVDGVNQVALIRASHYTRAF